MNALTDPVSPLSVALGAELRDVLFLDGSKGTASIRLLSEPDKDYPEFLRVVDDDQRLAEFVAKQEPGWAATLHPSSLLDVVERGMALNFPLVRRWAEFRTRKLALLQDLRGVVPAASGSPRL